VKEFFDSQFHGKSVIPNLEFTCVRSEVFHTRISQLYFGKLNQECQLCDAGVGLFFNAVVSEYVGECSIFVLFLYETYKDRIVSALI